MPQDHEKLDRIIESILNNANEESNSILRDFNVRHESIIGRKEDEILNEVYRYIRARIAEVRAESGKRVSQKSLDNKRVLSAKRADIAEEALSRVRTRIEAFTATDAYRAKLSASIAAAAGSLDCDDLEIYLRPADMGLAPELKAAHGGSYHEGDFVLGGVVFRSRAKGVSIDSTFDSALDAAAARFPEISGLGFLPGES